MTAYLVVARQDGAHLISDGAGVARDGTLSEIVSKPVLFPAFNAAIVVNGVVGHDWVRDDMAAAGVTTVDQALSALPIIAHGIRGRNIQIEEDFPDVSLIMIAWCPKRGASAWMCATGELAAARGMKPYAFAQIVAALEDADPEAVLGRHVDLLDPASFNPATDGLALMKDCRSRPADPEAWGGRTDHYGIGGMVELTTCGPSGIAKRELHRWHEDVIGQHIRPRG